MYMALSATPPFWGATDAEVLQRVRLGVYALSGAPWDRISDAAKDVIRRLLTFHPGGRASAMEALALPWVVAQGLSPKAG